LQDMRIEGRNGGSIVKYIDMTPGMLDLCSAMLTMSRGTAVVDSMFDTYRSRIQGNIQAFLWSRVRR